MSGHQEPEAQEPTSIKDEPREDGNSKGTPPNDLLAEKALLGAMMRSRDTIADVVEIVEPFDFYRPAHGLIYGVLLHLYAGDHEADVLAVAVELTRRKELSRVGGPEYLQALATAKLTGTAEKLAQRVRSTAMLRALMVSAQAVYEQASSASADAADEIGNFAQSTFFTAVKRQHAAAPAFVLGDVLEGVLDAAEATGRTDVLAGVPTGFAELDLLTGGLRPGQLVVLASRPAMGKSVLALDFLRSAAVRHRIPSVLFTLESDRNAIGMRLLAAEARVALHHMRSGNMTDEDWTRVARRIPELNDAPLYIQDAEYATLVDVRAQCRRLVNQHDVRLMVVDGLHLLTYGTRPFSSRYEEISEIARCLKLLAKELQLPIVAVSQLNRGPEQRTDKRPMITDLRDSGALEDNADIVVLLHREDAYEKESPRAGEADLIVAKHREGPTAMITVAFQGHYSRFVDMAQS